MNLQHERISALCAELRLTASIAQVYPELAQTAVKEEKSYADFLEAILSAEKAARQGRTRSTLTRLAGFPAIKTLDEFDYEFASGVPKATIQELASLAFVERNENIVLVAPREWAKPLWRSGWGFSAPKTASRVRSWGP